MHLPYVHSICNSDSVIVPIMVGEVSDKMMSEFASVLLPYFKDPSSVFLVSSDFCHWGERFDYQHHAGKGEIWERIQSLDMQGI